MPPWTNTLVLTVAIIAQGRSNRAWSFPSGSCSAAKVVPAFVRVIGANFGVLDAGLWLSMSDATADIRTADAEDPLAGVVRFRRPDDRDVDLIVGRPAWQDQVLQRATPLRLPDVTVPVVTAPDLILLKLYAGGSQDAWDIEQLLAGSSRSALIREVEQRVSVLPPEAVSLWHRLTRT